MGNNFTFRSRTETYFTYLSAQPLMILLRRETKSRSSFVVCVCAYIFLYTDVFLWRHPESPKSGRESDRESCRKHVPKICGEDLLFCRNFCGAFFFFYENTKMLITSSKINIFDAVFFIRSQFFSANYV